jgi:hypothetical protein
MIDSLCDSYQDQLTRLSDDQLLINLINEIGGNRAWWLSDRPWSRMSGKFDPRQKAYGTLVFQTQDAPQEICLIEVLRNSQEGRIAEETSMFVDNVGRLRLTRFPEDSSLPNLAKVLNEGTHARVVQYIPHHRCTIQFRQIKGGGPGFAKVFDSDVGRRIHGDGVALWNLAAQGELGFLVPRPGRWDEQNLTLWQGTVEGKPIRISQLFDAKGPDLAYKMGRAIATFHQSNMTPSIIFDKETVLQQAKRHGTELLDREPQLRGEVKPLLGELQQAHDRATHKKSVPLHTDLHPEQWLEHETGLGLVDFDRIALGDPEYDVASFLTELEFKDKGRGRISKATKAFWNGYESIAPPLYPPLLNTYRAHKWLAKALRAIGKIQVDGAFRAQQCLFHALECLSEKNSLC